MNWDKYAPYFYEKEFRCKHTGQCHMNEEYMDALLAIRIAYGKPMKVTSGYRHPTHPIEAEKGKPGEHSMGRCADFAVSGGDAVKLLRLALIHGMTRIGVQQKGTGKFLHLGMGGKHLSKPNIWSY